MLIGKIRRFSGLNSKLTMEVETRSKRHIKRQNDIIQVNLKNKTPLTLDNYAHRSDILNLGTIEKVAGQLGYHPYNIVNVVLQKCYDTNETDNHPLVAVLYPLNHNEEVGGRYAGKDGPKPFPTTFWMTCPDLHTRISKLEDLGYINKFQQQLLTDPNSENWLKQMHNAHKGYAAFRWSLLSEDDKLLIEASGW